MIIYIDGFSGGFSVRYLWELSLRGRRPSASWSRCEQHLDAWNDCVARIILIIQSQFGLSLNPLLPDIMTSRCNIRCNVMTESLPLKVPCLPICHYTIFFPIELIRGVYEWNIPQRFFWFEPIINADYFVLKLFFYVSLNDRLDEQFINSFNHRFTHSLARSLTHSLTHS